MKAFCDLPAITQKEVHCKVCTLLAEGNGYKKIRKILAADGIRISLGTLSYWCNKKTAFTSRNNSFSAKPTAELAYALGVLFGDGAISHHKKNHDYCIHLGAIDKEFVEKFSFCISKVLGKSKAYPVHVCKSGLFEANIRSKELYFFVKSLKEDFEKVKPFAERFPAEFIQGLADSEGCPGISASSQFVVNVSVANSTNLELLEYSKYLLEKHFRIHSRINLTKTPGMSDSIIDGRLITRTKNLYLLSIGEFSSTKEYCSKINFSIIRKKQKLEDAIKIKEKFCASQRIQEWEKLYYKVGTRWKRFVMYNSRLGRDLNPGRTRDRGES